MRVYGKENHRRNYPQGKENDDKERLLQRDQQLFVQYGDHAEQPDIYPLQNGRRYPLYRRRGKREAIRQSGKTDKENASYKRGKRRVELLYAKGRSRENRKTTESKQVYDLAQKTEHAKEIS